MADDGARRRGIQPDPPRPLGGQREDQIGVAPAVGMVVDAHAVEAGVLAARDDVGYLRNAAPDGNPDVDLHAPALLDASGPGGSAAIDRSRGRRARVGDAQVASARRTRLGSRSATRGTPVSART